MPPRFHLTVLAKAPVPGLAKTRLIPALGPEGAAALAERLLDHALDQALAAGFDTVELCVTPDADHPAVQRQAARPGLRLSLQGEGDLGARMARALDRALAQADAVTVPAHDGGYALIGLRRPAPALFEGMAWSTAGVLAATRARAAAAGLRLAELAPLHDIDEPADLVHLPAGWLPVGRGVGA